MNNDETELRFPNSDGETWKAVWVGPMNRVIRIFDAKNMTFWENMEAIKAFAGADAELAKYYPEDKDFLIEFEPRVVHYEVAGQSYQQKNAMAR